VPGDRKIHHSVRASHRHTPFLTDEDEAVFWIVWSFVFTICCVCCWRCFPKSVFRGSHSGRDHRRRGGKSSSSSSNNHDSSRGRLLGDAGGNVDGSRLNARSSSPLPSSSSSALSSAASEARRHSSRMDERQRAVAGDEAALSAKIKKMESQLAAKKLQRQVATARAVEAELEVELTEEQDERGRALYGHDAWDAPQDGAMPLRDLFVLREDELREIKIEAYNRIAAEEKASNGGRGTINTARISAMTARHKNESSRAHLEAQAQRRGGSGGSAGGEAARHLLSCGGCGEGGGHGDEDEAFAQQQEERASIPLTARTSHKTARSHRPKQAAPFDDPRFVNPRRDKAAPTLAQPPPPPPQQQQQRNVLGTTRPHSLPYPHAQASLAGRGGDSGDPSQSAVYPLPPRLPAAAAAAATADHNETRNDNAGLVMVQARGLLHPRPPPLPPPALRSSGVSRSKSRGQIAGAERANE